MTIFFQIVTGADQVAPYRLLMSGAKIRHWCKNSPLLVQKFATTRIKYLDELPPE